MTTVMKMMLNSLFYGVLFAALLSCTKERTAVAPAASSQEQKAKQEEIKKVAEATQELVAATVNGVDITVKELIREMNMIERRNGRGDGKPDSKTMDAVKREALDNLVVKELVIQESVKQGISIEPERIDKVIKEMKTQLGSDAAFQKYLDERFMTEADFRMLIERSHRFEMITAKEIYQKIKIEEKDIQSEYDKNKDSYKDKAGRPLKYDEAAPLIRRKLTAQAGATLGKAWGKSLREKARIVLRKDAA